MTANILAHNDDLPGVREYFEELKEMKPDALIIADPAIFDIAGEICPEITAVFNTSRLLAGISSSGCLFFIFSLYPFHYCFILSCFIPVSYTHLVG